MNLLKNAPLPMVLIISAACTTPSTPPSTRLPGREVVTTVTIPAAPERVLRAFLDADDLTGWWNVSRALVESEIGGTWAVAWDQYGEDKTSHVWTGVIRELGPRRVLIGDVVLVEPNRPLFAPLQIEVIAELADTGCVLRVIHRGYGYGADWDWAHETVVVGWRHVLGDLRIWFAAE